MPTAIHGVSVGHFYTTYRHRLQLELLTEEEGLHRVIREVSVNRPALALTGFFKFFANKRIQVLGANEMSYLKTLSAPAQEKIYVEMVRRQIPCIVLTRNFHATPPLLRVAQEFHLPVFRTPLITRNFVNLATLCIDNEFAPTTTEHATTIDIKGIGVMMRGPSGIGKSECALALIDRGYSLVADDLTDIKLLNERELTATSRALNRGWMECRGIGIINVAEMFGVRSIRVEKRVDLVVSLLAWTPDAVDERTGLEENHYEILGIKVPHIEIFVRPGRDIARLVEVAALIQAQKAIGRNPAREFNDRLIAHMAGQTQLPPYQHGLPARERPRQQL